LSPLAEPDIRLADHDQALRERTIQDRVQRPSGHPHRAVRQLGRASHDRVTMQRPVDQRREREIARGPKFHAGQYR
jgi:hypothetical protein